MAALGCARLSWVVLACPRLTLATPGYPSLFQAFLLVRKLQWGIPRTSGIVQTFLLGPNGPSRIVGAYLLGTELAVLGCARLSWAVLACPGLALATPGSLRLFQASLLVKSSSGIVQTFLLGPNGPSRIVGRLVRKSRFSLPYGRFG